MADDALPGPVDFVLIEFPPAAPVGPTVQALVDLLDSGVVRLFDVALVSKAGGTSTRIDLAASDFAAVAGGQSGLFDDDDIVQAGAALDDDTTALLLAYENAWAIPFVTAAHEAGGQMVASQRIPAQVLLDALDAAEAGA